jgi:hypothetical protein
MRGDQSIRVAPEVWAKLDPALRQALQSLSFDPSVALPVVIVLAEPSGAGATLEAPQSTRDERARLAREREAAFTVEVADLVRELAAQNATDIQPLWLNRTVAARVALPGMEAAAQRPDVRQILLAVRRPVTA